MCDSVYESMYGFNFGIKSFAVENEFVQRMSMGSYSLGKSLQPFCFCVDKTQQEWGVLDIANFGGFIDSNKTLMQEICDLRREMYQSSNFGQLASTDLINTGLFYDYLLSISLCYVEVPKYIKKNGVPTQITDKFLATRNPAIIAAWMGITPKEAQVKYGYKVSQTCIDFGQGEVKLAVLKAGKRGNSVTIPRTPSPVQGMRCIPLFMQYAFTHGFYELLENKIIKFTYQKDNGTIRELSSTVNFDILIDYYHDGDFIAKMLQGLDIFSVDIGGMQLGSKQSRGYLKVPELGCSRYDYSGVRSLNISRLLHMEVVDAVDRTFINVDLNHVIDIFKQYLEDFLVSNQNKILQIKTALGMDNEQYSSVPVTFVDQLKVYSDNLEAIYTTQYRKQLHMFMISHPEIFSNYTGIPEHNPNAVIKTNNNIGIA